MKNLQLYKKSYFNNVVIVTGTHCSGKSMVSPITSSLTNVEHVRKLYTVDQILDLTLLKKIKEEVSIFIIRHFLDNSFYEQLIGRNLNFRVEDETSIFTAKNTSELMSRIIVKRGDHIIKKNIKNKKIFVMDTHDGIMLFDFWRKVNKNFKFINVFRNPIDTTASWFKHKLGVNEKVLINQIVLLKNKNYKFPFYAIENYKKYNKQNEMDRVIDMVMYCQRKEYENYKKYKKNKNCIFFEFEDFATKTNQKINEICKFLKTSRSKHTQEIMKRENCPRPKEHDKYLENLYKIKKLASKKSFYNLLEFEKVFFQRKKNII